MINYNDLINEVNKHIKQWIKRMNPMKFLEQINYIYIDILINNHKFEYIEPETL